MPSGFELENQTSKGLIQLPQGFELEKSASPGARQRPYYGFSQGSSYASPTSGSKSAQWNGSATKESRDFFGVNKPAQTSSATPWYRNQKAPASPEELAAGERIWQGIQDDQAAKFDDLNAAFRPLTRQQATEGLSRESAEYKAAVTGGRKPLHRRDAALSGTTLPVDPAFDIAPPETSGVPPSMMRSYKGFQGAYGERHLSPVQYDRLTAAPLPEETLDEYEDRIDRILDEGRPKWIKALRDARGTATQWGHDVAADAAELYLNINGVYREQHPTMVGVARSTAGFVGGMATDPVTYVLGGTGSIARNVGRRLMATGFSIYSGAGAYEQARQLREIWNRSDISYEQKVEISTGLALNVAMAGLSARHGLHSPRTIPLEKGFLNEISALGKNAERDILSRFQEKFNEAVAEKLGERLQRQEPGAQIPGQTRVSQPAAIQFRQGDYVTVGSRASARIERTFPRLRAAQMVGESGERRVVRFSRLAHRLVQQGGPHVAATYDIFPIRKGRPTQQEAAVLGKAPRRPAQGTGKSRDFQIKTCGPQETLIQGGGEKVWADGLEISDGMARDAKYLRRQRRSMYVEGSGIDSKFRGILERPTVEEFRRYAAIIQDPKSPIRALEVIVSDRASVSYFLKLMKRFGIPGHIVIK